MAGRVANFKGLFENEENDYSCSLWFLSFEAGNFTHILCGLTGTFCFLFDLSFLQIAAVDDQYA